MLVVIFDWPSVHDIFPGHSHQVLSITLIDELLSQVQSERIFYVITCKKCDFVPDASPIYYNVGSGS